MTEYDRWGFEIREGADARRGFTMGQLARLEKSLEILGCEFDQKPLIYMLGYPNHFSPAAYDEAEKLAQSIWRLAEETRRRRNE